MLTFAAIVVLRRAFQAGHAAHDASQEASVHPGGSTAPSASPRCACYVSLALYCNCSTLLRQGLLTYLQRRSKHLLNGIWCPTLTTPHINLTL